MHTSTIYRIYKGTEFLGTTKSEENAKKCIELGYTVEEKEVVCIERNILSVNTYVTGKINYSNYYGKRY